MKTDMLHRFLLDNMSGNHGEVKIHCKHFIPAEAEEIAKELQEADPDWKYSLVFPPEFEGHACIEAHDKDGNFMGRF